MSEVAEKKWVVAEGEKVIGREFRFAFHIPSNDQDIPDYHFVKEQVHYEVDGKVVVRPTLRLIPNFQRPVYFTKPTKRTHKEKKEVESLDNLMRIDCRQSDLKRVIAKMTNDFGGFKSLRDLCASPYVYAADIPSTLFLRRELYDDKYPNLLTPRTVATFDTETNMFTPEKEIIIASTAYENKIVVAVDKKVLPVGINVAQAFNDSIHKHLQKYIERDNLEVSLIVVDSEIEVIKACFHHIHQWQPDFLAIWNMNYDIPKILAAFDRAGMDPADVLCDPRIPKSLRLCEYQPGQTSQPTAGGKHKIITPANQWHTFELTASFYIVDSMCAYRRIRSPGAELPSYALDDILSLELDGLTKLKIPEADRYIKAEWHKFMQKNMIIDYLAYGAFDSYSMLLLDRKTKDLSRTLSFLAQKTSFKDYSSQSKRLRDNFYQFGIEHLGLVLAAAGPVPKDKPVVTYSDNEDSVIEEDDEIDKDGEELTTLDRRNWVVTLRAFMTVHGLPLIREDRKLRTLIRTFVYDSDVVSSYPNCILVANVSKMTTRKEIARIGDVPEAVFRMQNLNFIFGQTNALEYGQAMFNLPTLKELNQLYQRQHGKQVVNQ